MCDGGVVKPEMGLDKLGRREGEPLLQTDVLHEIYGNNISKA